MNRPPGLDDYHSLDRNGRKEAGVTALAPESQAFDLMYEQVGGEGFLQAVGFLFSVFFVCQT